MILIIKGKIAKAADSFHATLLQYHFSITPMKQTIDGRDRVFTFSFYTTSVDRDTSKHSRERNLIAKRLRTRHSTLWRHFHEEMDPF